MRSFGHKRPVRDTDGKITGWKDSPVSAVTKEALGGQFGRDRNRRLVVTLAAGDVIAMRPLASPRTRTVTGTAQDIYRYLLRCAVLACERKVREYKKIMTLKEARKRARKEFGL
ncbi:MAG TPA: hypothetical protein VGY56_02500 [Verrucomicrobiae bacterium]|nr:hypothetical protein [Verrucomicrobiae bacterium]